LLGVNRNLVIDLCLNLYLGISCLELSFHFSIWRILYWWWVGIIFLSRKLRNLPVKLWLWFRNLSSFLFKIREVLKIILEIILVFILHTVGLLNLRLSLQQTYYAFVERKAFVLSWRLINLYLPTDLLTSLIWHIGVHEIIVFGNSSPFLIKIKLR
jgi:hypothetical protein